MSKPPRRSSVATTHGIGEWYGYDIFELSGEQRKNFATYSKQGGADKKPCPFRLGRDCTKKGGVCSIRAYTSDKSYSSPYDVAVLVPGDAGQLIAVCPNRFYEGDEVFRVASKAVMKQVDFTLVSEVGFLEGETEEGEEKGNDVGRIDMVIVGNEKSDNAPLSWLALEIQAVYFSGKEMPIEFDPYLSMNSDDVVFPQGRRRPDFRSSGPKRLMPQLQIKVPTLRRWGKKMVVVVDSQFFNSLGKMDDVSDISNGDIVWIVVRFEKDEETGRRIKIESMQTTTLERAVEGLTGGKPVPLSEFETRIKEKIEREQKPKNKRS